MKKSSLRVRNFQDILKYMMNSRFPASSSAQVLVLFDSTDESLRADVRRLVRSGRPGQARAVSLWDLRRADDLPPFDRREILGRLRILFPDGRVLEGAEARAWMEEATSVVESAPAHLAAA
ncbi:MAG: hypothetical protein OHK005_18960 [Candidatus Methylacidiphilales bacterium]